MINCISFEFERKYGLKNGFSFDMGILDDLLFKVRNFNNQLERGELIADILQDNETEIVEMNSEDQLYEKGVTATGVSIESFAPYSNYTIEIKQMKGQPTDRVTLRDTGDFHNAFYLEIDKDKFEIWSHDWKARTLVDLYGWDIFGLTPDNIKDLEQYILLPQLNIKARKLLF